MAAILSTPPYAREFALTVLNRLRAAGHEAFWAGGCVRDELLGRLPADYDVATSAPPSDVQTLFGRRHTHAVGAAFGVITVVGPRDAGQVEVTTFRTDGPYSDGRHPAGVAFSTAKEDAQRRDFTINGLFLDPISGEVHDYVGGRADLAAGIVRAIGVPAMRFGEDHLRMLRAVRFTAGFGFALDLKTRQAIESMAHLIVSVSPERIAAELRTMMARPGRQRAIELLDETGLAREVLREVALPEASGTTCQKLAWQESARIIESLERPELAVSLAILAENAQKGSLEQIAGRLRLSNYEMKTAGWLREAIASLTVVDPLTRDAVETGIASEQLHCRPWSLVQPWLAHESAFLLADAMRARAACGRGGLLSAAWISQQVARPRHQLDPPPLVTGIDLLQMGVPSGRQIGTLLATLRAMQLDATIATREEAIAWVESREA